MITFTDTTQKVWKYLINAGMTQAGVAGMMGNMYAESKIISNKVEDLCLQRLREIGKYYTDATYTAFVDDGTISRSGFLNPLPGKQYGYGLCQWTSQGRKAGLYDLCKQRGASVGDLNIQLEYLISELKGSYKNVWNVLTATSDILTASNKVLLDFEQPSNIGDSVKQTRYSYGKEIYNKYAAQQQVTSMTKDQAIQLVIDIAIAELGYMEKSNSANLDSKTAGASNGNWTKYWRDVYPQFQGQPWCAVFIAWLFMMAFGLDAAKRLLKHWPFTYCPTLASMTTIKTPQKGSIALFWRDGTYVHTEYVIAVTASTITTIGGNTSDGNSVVANGGAVCRKTYSRSSLSANNKYFMPDYSIVASSPTTQTTQTTATKLVTATGTAEGYDKTIAGTYKTTGKIHIRNSASTSAKSLIKMAKGQTVQCYGYYSTAKTGNRWYYAQAVIDGVTYTGFSASAYLKRT